jgi:hypothetical protein
MCLILVIEYDEIKRNEKRHTIINPSEISLEKLSFPNETKKRNTIEMG